MVDENTPDLVAGWMKVVRKKVRGMSLRERDEFEAEGCWW